jgi:hypothetical protein
MYSHTVSSFPKIKILCNYKSMKNCFQQFSYEIFQFLSSDDINSLKMTNNFFYDLCHCHLLLTESIKSLEDLYACSLQKDETPVLKSKFKDKFNFNRSMNEFYKGSEKMKERIQSGRKRK